MGESCVFNAISATRAGGRPSATSKRAQRESLRLRATQLTEDPFQICRPLTVRTVSALG